MEIAKIRENDEVDADEVIISIERKNAKYRVVLSNGDEPALPVCTTQEKAESCVEAAWSRWETFEWTEGGV